MIIMLVTKINLNLSKMQIIHSMDLENWGKKNSNSNYENSKLMFLSNHFFFCIWGLPHITSSAKGEGGKKSREIP